MKKIILIAIALIAMMGTASAYSAQLYDDAGTAITTDNPIEMKPGDTKLIYYGVSQILETQVGSHFAYTLTELTAYTSTGAVDGQLVITLPTNDLVPTSAAVGTDGLYISPDPITLTLHPDTDLGASFYFKIKVGGNDYGGVYLESADTSRTINSVPEFPTIALPVAAILGLAFIFQRRREED